MSVSIYITILLGVWMSLGINADKNCGLECWLNHLQFSVPSISFTEISVTFNASGIVCQNITLEQIDSDYENPLIYTFYGSGIGVNCNGDWSVSAPHLGTYTGTVSFAVLNSFLGFSAQFFTNTAGLITNAKLNSCQGGFHLDELEFTTDDYFARIILNGLTSTIQGYIEEQLNTTLCPELSSFVLTNSTQYFQSINYYINQYLNPPPPGPPPPLPPGMTKLNSSPLIELSQYFLNHVIGIDGVLNVNLIADQLAPNGVAYYNNSVNITVPVPGYGNVTLGLLSLSISGLNSWSQLSMLNNVMDDPYMLNSMTALDKMNISVNFSVEVDLSGSGAIKGRTLYETGNIFLALTNTNLTVLTQVGMMEDMMYNEFTSPSSIQADPLLLLIPLKNIYLAQIHFWMDLDLFNLTSLSGDIESQFDNALDNVFKLLTTQYKEIIPAMLYGYISGPVREETNELINVTLTPYEDRNVTDETSHDLGFDEFDTIIAASSAVGLFMLIFVLLCVCSANSVLPNPEEDQYLSLKRQNYKCIAVSHHIPKVLRYGIPLVILSNIALFVSANTGIGATVYVQLTFNGTEVQTPSLFSFSLANSIDDMWQAEVYALSLLIAVFSGAWPYLKLVLMLISWIVPTKILSARHREYVIMVLDALGKWSLIDAYVLTLMIVAFRFTLAPDSIHSQMDVLVEPEWGFYAFLLATMLSLILTHIILASHRKIMKEEKRSKGENIINSANPNPKKRKALCSISFSTGILHFAAPIFITILLLLSICLLILGSYWISFQFEFQGAAALALSYLSQSTTQDYSLLTLGLALPHSSSNPNDFGIRLIQTTFFLFAFVLPLLLLFFLLVLWLVPLSRKAQRRLFVVSEILNAWSAIDVFVVSIIASLLEISQFAQFIIGDRCDLINVFIGDYFNEAVDGVDKCFDVVTRLETGCWLLFCACISYILSSMVVMRACHRAISKRDKEEQLQESIYQQSQSKNEDEESHQEPPSESIQ